MESVLLTVRKRRATTKAGDDRPFCPTLGSGVGCLWWFSGNDEDAYDGGDPCRSSRAVGLARTVKNRCGGERGEARVSRAWKSSKSTTRRLYL
jgi:hypothetical protein